MAEAQRRRCATDPAYKQRISERIHAFSRSPEGRRQASQRLLERPIYHLGQQACGGPGSPARIRAGRTHSDRRLAWCPPDYRDLYREMLAKGVGAQMAREATIAQIDKDLRAWRRKLHRLQPR